VNLAARLEKIASQTKRTIVASEGFAGICRGGWSDLGEFPVAGFAKAARVYGLADETSAPDAAGMWCGTTRSPRRRRLTKP
jgi:adenylate cyclase